MKLKNGSRCLQNWKNRLLLVERGGIKDCYAFIHLPHSAFLPLAILILKKSDSHVKVFKNKCFRLIVLDYNLKHYCLFSFCCCEIAV